MRYQSGEVNEQVRKKSDSRKKSDDTNAGSLKKLFHKIAGSFRKLFHKAFSYRLPERNFLKFFNKKLFKVFNKKTQ